LLETYDDRQMINIGGGKDVMIKELADLIAEAVGFKGEVLWDISKPDGASRKLLDSSRLFELGWKPSIGFKEGLLSCL
jgi:GDP-L-fucose synthase